MAYRDGRDGEGDVQMIVVWEMVELKVKILELAQGSSHLITLKPWADDSDQVWVSTIVKPHLIYLLWGLRELNEWNT